DAHDRPPWDRLGRGQRRRGTGARPVCARPRGDLRLGAPARRPGREPGLDTQALPPERRTRGPSRNARKGRPAPGVLSISRHEDLLTPSTRELYSSGLLNTRLDGEVYLALYLEREPFRLAAEHAGGLDYLTLSAPMRIDREGTMGVISIPLTGQRRAIERKVQEVEDAVLISTCLTVILLAGVGYLVARRVSEPITLLARAACRVAEGDLDVRVRAAARDEIGILVDAFNRMAASLREQRAGPRRRKAYIEK